MINCKTEFIEFYLPWPDISSAYFWHKTAWHEIKTKLKAKQMALITYLKLEIQQSNLCFSTVK